MHNKHCQSSKLSLVWKSPAVLDTAITRKTWTYPWLRLVVRGLECSCTKSRRGAGGWAAAVGTGSSVTADTAGDGTTAQGSATGTGDVGRTTPLLRVVTGRPVSPVTTRTDNGDFGSSSVNKNNTVNIEMYKELTDYSSIYLLTKHVEKKWAIYLSSIGQHLSDACQPLVDGCSPWR